MNYDTKYRRRAIDYWDEEHSRRATAEVFKVSASTLQAWKSQLKETDKLGSKKCRETWYKTEPAKFPEYLEQNPDVYPKEITEELGCSDVAVFKILR